MHCPTHPLDGEVQQAQLVALRGGLRDSIGEQAPGARQEPVDPLHAVRVPHLRSMWLDMSGALTKQCRGKKTAGAREGLACRSEPCSKETAQQVKNRAINVHCAHQEHAATESPN